MRAPQFGQVNRSAWTAWVPGIGSWDGVGVNDLSGLELSIQDGKFPAGRGVTHVNSKGFFEELALLPGVVCQPG